MFACGIIGFLAGMLGQSEILKKREWLIYFFGTVAAFCIYGGILK